MDLYKLYTPNIDAATPYYTMAPATATLESDFEATVDDGNGLVCFTNCFLPQEDGSMIEKDLWIDGRRGVILDAHVSERMLLSS